MKRSLKILFCLSLLAFVLGIGNISAKAEEKYDVWIGGTQVTSSNKNNIPGKNGGYAAYDPDTKTLTFYDFKEVKVSSECSLKPDSEGEPCGFLVYAAEDLTIKGTASFSDEPYDYMVGIYSDGTLRVEGKFDITTRDKALFGYDGLYINGEDTVVNTVTDYFGCTCILSNGDVYIEKCKVSCSSDADETTGIGGANVHIKSDIDVSIIVEKGRCIRVGDLGIIETWNAIIYARCNEGLMGYDVGLYVPKWVDIDCSISGNPAIIADHLRYSGARYTSIIEPLYGYIHNEEAQSYIRNPHTHGPASHAIMGDAYFVYIGDVMINYKNKDRIEGKNGGYATFDPDTFTLTFYDFKDVKVEGDQPEYYIHNIMQDLTIKGTASFGTDTLFYRGINSRYTLNISGNFDIKSKWEPLESDGNIVISGKDTVVNANVVNEYGSAGKCILCKGTVEVKNGKLNASSNVGGFTGIEAAGLIVSGGKVSSDASGGIYTDEISITGGEVAVKGVSSVIEAKNSFTLSSDRAILTPVGGRIAKTGDTYKVFDDKGDKALEVYIAKSPITITMNPSDTAVEEGQLAFFEVKATGNNLKYLWQYKEKGKTTWTDWGSKTKPNISVAYLASRNGMSFRCIIIDASGITVTSGEAVLTYTAASSSTFAITEQPKNTTVVEKELAYFSVKAKGEGLTYLWQYKEKGKTTWTDWTAKTSPDISVAYSKSRNGMSLRCKVTNKDGIELISNVATLTYKSATAPSITEQPKNASVKAGELAYFSVKATGEGLTYLWQYKNKGESSWTSWTSKKTASISVAYLASRNGMSLRCVVTDKNGEKITSSTAVLTYTSATTIAITEHPKNATAAENGLAYFSIKATGEGLTYLWQYKNAGSSTWTDWTSKKTAEISVAYAKSRNGMSLRCVVTDKNGNKLTSNEAVLTYTTALKITTQPANSTVNKNELAYFGVKAEGKGLTYMWQYKLAGDSTWTDWTSKKTADISVAYAAYRNNMQLRCVITDSNGNTVTSNVVTLKYNAS